MSVFVDAAEAVTSADVEVRDRGQIGRVSRGSWNLSDDPV
jgi:hypothetical protein